MTTDSPAERQAPPQISDEPGPERCEARMTTGEVVVQCSRPAGHRYRHDAGSGYRPWSDVDLDALASTPQEACDLAAVLRDAIAECLYEHANKDENGPGGGVKHWREFTDSWVMGAVREVVAAGLASREAEVRRQVAGEVRALFADPLRAMEFLNSNGLSRSCGPGSAALAIAAEIEAER